MKGEIVRFCAEGTDCSVYLPPQARVQRVAVLYMNQVRVQDWDGFLPELERGMGRTLRPAALVCVHGADWNRDFSPWPAEPLHAGEAGFAGLADAWIDRLVYRVKPAVDAHFPTLAAPAHTGIIGYSLGGLAALYALTRSGVFGLAGCLSGSLWYAGFMDYLRAHPVLCPQARVYLSLGRKEERTRHPLLMRIGDCCRDADALLRAQLGDGRVRFDLNNGGHGTEVDRRMLLGLSWLLGE